MVLQLEQWIACMVYVEFLLSIKNITTTSRTGHRCRMLVNAVILLQTCSYVIQSVPLILFSICFIELWQRVVQLFKIVRL